MGEINVHNQGFANGKDYLHKDRLEITNKYCLSNFVLQNSDLGDKAPLVIAVRFNRDVIESTLKKQGTILTWNDFMRDGDVLKTAEENRKVFYDDACDDKTLVDALMKNDQVTFYIEIKKKLQKWTTVTLTTTDTSD